ncbi:SDR family oxidoreductase [Nocardioides sp. LML1-1-1.1]|uniref:SDR family oxidoreductase n=1 Tax=Nocardioides sp. LML1-1-1.1 TaxID=3135248 RepID=UPI003431E8FA
MSKTIQVRGAVVAITGGARGIGRATARAFLESGARVAIGDVDAAAAKETARELAEAARGKAIGLPLDVTSRDSLADFLDGTVGTLGDLSVLVNNAGIMPTGLFSDEALVMTERMIDINLRGVVHGSALAIKHFGDRRGHIINVASLAGVAGFPGVATYCATKHAVIGFTEALHRELRDQDIGVTAVLPGVVRTELSAGNSVPGWIRPLAEVDPEDVARAIVGTVGSRRTRVSVPRPMGALLKTMSLMPDGARQFSERLARFDSAFTKTDPVARAAYHQRINGEHS